MTQLTNSIINGKVIVIKPSYVLVQFDNLVGICHIKEISDYLVKNIYDMFKINNHYDFKVLNYTEDGKLQLSYKALHPKLLKKHNKIIATASGFTNLKEYVDKLIEKY